MPFLPLVIGALQAAVQYGPLALQLGENVVNVIKGISPNATTVTPEQEAALHAVMEADYTQAEQP